MGLGTKPASVWWTSTHADEQTEDVMIKTKKKGRTNCCSQSVSRFGSTSLGRAQTPERSKCHTKQRKDRDEDFGPI